jgi:hypothetical protein
MTPQTKTVTNVKQAVPFFGVDDIEAARESPFAFCARMR